MTLPAQKLEVLAIIPARGGSKSLPRKNVLPLLGKPLLAYSIEDARRSRMITRVLVSTDDAEIAQVARAAGAETPFLRPAELAGDFSVDIEYLRHALEWLAAHEHYQPDLVVTLRPTEPMRNVATIDRAIALLAATPEADSLRSVRRANETPFKMWFLEADGFLRPALGLEGVAEPYNQPRQRLPVAYWQDGYIDVTRPATILGQRSPTGRRVLPFVIEEPSVNIDYADELKRAEAAFSERAAGVPQPPGLERFPA